MGRFAIVLVVAACGHSSGNGQSDAGEVRDAGLDAAPAADGASPGDVGGASDARASDAAVADAAASSPDAAVTSPDAAVTTPDAGASTHAMTELGEVSCWSVGGFMAVYHDQPAHIVVTLQDQDGIADIETTAAVTIVGKYGATYDVGPRPLISLGNTGCCDTTVKVPIYYDDFIAAGQAIGGPDGFWSAYATFRDHTGTSIVARCDDEWFLDDAYYGG